MATIKISQLQQIESLNSNTSNTIFVGVDLPTGVTGKFTATTIAEKLYLNNPLNVGNNSILFPNTVAQFSGSGDAYLQLNMQNFSSNGSGDIVITADNGTNANAFIDMGINGSTFDSPEYSSMKKNDGYIFVTGPDFTTEVGNLVLGAASAGANVNFVVGGYEESNVVANFSKSGLTLIGTNLTFSDGSVQSTASAPAQFTQDAYNTANNIGIDLTTANNWLQANDSLTLTAALSHTDTANTYIQSHYLANTTGTFSGNLTLTGNVVSNYSVTVNNKNLPANKSLFTGTMTSNNAIGTPSNPGYTFYTAVDGGNRIAGEAYGAEANNYVGFIGRRARGTAEAPTAVANNDIILRLGGNAYGTTKFSQYADARIEFVATETHSDSSKGTQIQFWTTPSGSNTAVNIGTMNGDFVTLSGYMKPEKGFVYTPRLEPDNTTLTINFKNDSLIQANLSSNFSINFTNYVPGKVVEVWLLNTSGLNRTITHGCSATNSTLNSTTFSIPSTSCAYLRYFSVASDVANTFVSVTQGQ